MVDIYKYSRKLLEEGCFFCIFVFIRYRFILFLGLIVEIRFRNSNDLVKFNSVVVLDFRYMELMKYRSFVKVVEMYI